VLALASEKNEYGKHGKYERQETSPSTAYCQVSRLREHFELAAGVSQSIHLLIIIDNNKTEF
jgi:hypothetical protein